jgi:UDP-N-acetylmuramoyl-L-alanyl-D-glutamate--2,6-diaminopimelate ligase
MLLSRILNDLHPIRTHGDLSLDISRVIYDSRLAGPGDLFVALRGKQTDGHQHIHQAFERGAVAAVVEEPVDAPCWAQVADTLPALALAARSVYGCPAEALKLIGVTGTNGKTTTTYLIEAIGQSAGKSMGLLGTIEYRWPGFSKPSPHTTPFSSDLQEGLAEMRKAGVGSVVLEVSSHALALHRVDTIEFDVAVFTNLTPEHLDFHGNMESYAATKLRLFTEYLKAGGKAVINLDDHWGRHWLHELLPHTVLTYGFGREAQVHPENSAFEADGTEAVIWTPCGRLAIESNLVGRHNLHNLLAAISACLSLGINLDDIERGIRAGVEIPGRLQAVSCGQPFQVFVDYAHTPDGVLQVLATLREISHRRLICVLGCGGDRDRKKRPRMASIAQENSNLVVLTSDNPRTEDPERILDEMEAGMIGVAGSRYMRITDRREAIIQAAGSAGPGDIVLIAGKGHENYQEIGRERHPFDDRLVVAEALAALGYRGGKA